MSTWPCVCLQWKLDGERRWNTDASTTKAKLARDEKKQSDNLFASDLREEKLGRWMCDGSLRMEAVGRKEVLHTLKAGDTRKDQAFFIFCLVDNSVYKAVPARAMTVPTNVFVVSLFPKNSTDVPMMTTRFTTLHTP